MSAFSFSILTPTDQPALQKLFVRCPDYFEIVEGQAAGPDAAAKEMSEWPDGCTASDLFLLGIWNTRELIGTIIAYRNYPCPQQWYLGLLLIDPAHRQQRLGSQFYRAFEQWVKDQGAKSILLAIVEANLPAAAFWNFLGFGQPRCYPSRRIGYRDHILIEYEKTLTCKDPDTADLRA